MCSISVCGKKQSTTEATTAEFEGFEDDAKNVVLLKHSLTSEDPLEDLPSTYLCPDNNENQIEEFRCHKIVLDIFYNLLFDLSIMIIIK